MAYETKIKKHKEAKESNRPKYYVTMTDKFMSGWGRAEGKTNKYVVECDSWEEAKEIERNAEKRKEMKYINITSNKPSYNSKYYLTSNAKYKDLSGSWKDKRKYVEGKGWIDNY